MKYYAVIDTNVIVSAMLSAHPDAATVQVFGRMLAGDIIPLYSAETLAEYREVLHRRKFRFPADKVDIVLAAIEAYGLAVDPARTEYDLPDSKDVPFYAIVMEKREDDAYLVTGNIRHFPREPYIVTAREMLELMDAQ